MKRNGRKLARSARAARQEYANSPLVETVFEIRFSGEPAVECHRDEFFAKIRDEFPVVGVPNVQPGQALALQPYHFKSADGAETVMIAMNRFAYTTQRYGGFHSFKPKALDLTRRFCKQFEIKRLERTGLRYVNVIPFLREDGTIPWKRYFTVDLALPENKPDDFTNVGLAFECRCKNGLITTRIACGKTIDGSREVFLLDFDFAKTEALTATDLDSYIEESHEHTKKVFEGIVSENYKAVMRGEVVQ